LKGIKSKEGGEIWTRDFWYTMNSFSAADFEP
jgi:hypothetical protein